jgi:uncharacterized membrane protein YeaQ/YmgE (transglycosylase-associated protein family)
MWAIEERRFVMGFLVWLIAGVLVGVVVRQAVRIRKPDGHSAPLSAGAVGGLVGGYIADLFHKGDAVAHFRGPSVIGAIIGALILLGVFVLVGWTARTEDDGREPWRS